MLNFTNFLSKNTTDPSPTFVQKLSKLLNVLEFYFIARVSLNILEFHFVYMNVLKPIFIFFKLLS